MNDFSKLWDTWWTQLAPYIPYIAVALLIIIILVVRGKMRKKEAEQEKAAKIKREIEEEEKKKQRAIERKQQEQQDKEFLCACREDLKNNLLQYTMTIPDISVKFIKHHNQCATMLIIAIYTDILLKNAPTTSNYPRSTVETRPHPINSKKAPAQVRFSDLRRIHISSSFRRWGCRGREVLSFKKVLPPLHSHSQ